MSIMLMSHAWVTALKSTPKLVLVALADNASDEGYCWPSISYLTKKTSLSERSLFKHIADLEKDGWLERQQRYGKKGNQISNAYQLNISRLFSQDIRVPKGVHDVQGGGAQNAYHRTVNRTIKENNFSSIHEEDKKVPKGTQQEASASCSETVDEKSKTSLDINEVFEHWKKTFKKPKAQLLDKRKRLIKKWMKFYSIEDLKKAITGCSHSAWHTGDNPERKEYTGLDLILRSEEKIEGFIELFGKPQTANKSTVKEILNKLPSPDQAMQHCFAKRRDLHPVVVAAYRKSCQEAGGSANFGRMFADKASKIFTKHYEKSAQLYAQGDLK